MDIISRKNEENLILNSQSSRPLLMSGERNELVEMDSNDNQTMAINLPSVGDTMLQQFFGGANILITGGTGFMGKILIEKLLRTCPGIENIYLLVRSKKGKDVHTRVEEIFDDPVFSRLKEEVPKFRHKVVAVPGDCAIAGLGMTLTDRQTLINSVTMVFHAAATVRFDEKLKLAVGINVQGTRDVLDLCKEMRKLQSVIHVSTAYSNCHLKEIGEKFYDCPINYQELDMLLEKLDEKAVDEITPSILGQWPNTYAFTKALAEDLVKNNSTGLPIGMFRPAIVTSTIKEPVVGWIDNLYGPTGVVAGAGTGVLRTMHCDKDINANIVPVDMTVNALMAASWDVAKNGNKRSGAEMPVYNYVSSVENPLTWGQFTDLNVRLGFEFPFSSAIWYYCFSMNKSAAMNRLYMIFLHFLPAMLIDSLALCVGQTPRLLKVYKKIHKFSNVISFFCTNEWKFSNDNIQNLWLKLPHKDQQMFPFSIQDIDWAEYLRFYIRGMRIYLFKDDLTTVSSARRKWNRFYWLHQILKLLLVFISLYSFWSLFASFIY